EIDLVEDHWYGDTYSKVQAKGCRVQFVVPLDRMTDRDVLLVPGSETASRSFGRSCRTIASRLSIPSQLRPKLLEAGSDPAVRARAEQSAREFFEKRFAEWLRTELRMGRDVTIDVRWTE
ncbi:MAG: hypothetical protein ACKOEP_04495, partial [Phycisphaerales bacterium]